MLDSYIMLVDKIFGLHPKFNSVLAWSTTWPLYQVRPHKGSGRHVQQTAIRALSLSLFFFRILDFLRFFYSFFSLVYFGVSSNGHESVSEPRSGGTQVCDLPIPASLFFPHLSKIAICSSSSLYLSFFFPPPPQKSSRKGLLEITLECLSFIWLSRWVYPIQLWT